MTGNGCTDYESWGRVSRASHQAIRPSTRDEAAACLAVGERPVLAYGCGRSYGDAAMNPGGRLIDCRDLDRFIAFDRATGVLTCEAGVTLADILAVACRPDADGSGWLLPVTPGTRFVTVGGAIANDVHGKNHHISGTFGTHVLSFELARGDGSRLVCSANDNSDLFAATIGGLGLTGLILSATIQMRRVSGLAVEAEDIRFDNLDGYFALAAESDAAWEYTAAWIDCLARGPHLGRGIFSRARHVPGRGVAPPPRQPRRSVPMVPPVSLITPWTVRIFNAAYWRRLGSRGRSSQVGSYEKAFFPLDALGHWNRIYGPRGFYQFQCQLPTEGLRTKLRELLEMVAESGQASMLTTLKLFGDRPSPGLLSFPAPGATLALDFANRGASTLALLGRLERKVRDSGGRLYAAKDGVMAAETFHAGYPRVGRFLPHIDPIFASAFARRVALISTAVLESVPMNERLSRSQTVAIFGATSDIAIAVARCYAESGCRLILIGRDANSLAVLAADLGVRGSPETHILLADFSDLQGLPALASRAWDRIGGIHLALVAYGTMSVQQEAEQNAPTAEIVLTVNFTSPAILLNELANRFQSQGHGTIAAITSVAGDRGRKSNYFYGSAKGGLQRLLEGLRHRMASAGVTVVDIRPGFVSTKMTAHLNRKGPLWASPERVAADIVKAITTGRMVCYTPGFWRLIMLIVRSVPRFLFHRTSL